MYFDLTDDQKMLRDQVESLLADRLGDQQVLALVDADTSWNPALFSALVDMGLPAILVPEAKGGLGMDLLTLAVAAEAQGKFAAPTPIIANALAAWLLSHVDGKDDDVGQLIGGEAIAAFAFCGGSGWTPDAWRLAGPTLAGEVAGVEWGERATHFIVGLAGGGLGLVRAGAPGLTVQPQQSVDRTRPVAKLVFEGAAVEALPLKPETIARLQQAILVAYAADAVGAANKALGMAIEYAKVRKQFGRVIGSFQGLKFQLVDLAIEVEPSRPLVWYAAHCWDAIPAQAERMAALAKAHTTDVAVKTGRGAIEAHGGIGYTWEYPLHVWLKRAMHDRTIFGAPSEHRTHAAALAGW